MNALQKKRILVLVDWFYPGYKAGGPIQSCRNFITAMQESFDISVITSDRDLGDTQTYPGIVVNQWSNYTAATKVFYAQALTLKQLQQLVNEVVPDYIYLNSMFSPRFTLYPLWLCWRNKIKGRIVLAPRGMLQQGALVFSPQKKRAVLAFLKASGVGKKITFHATDLQEQNDVRVYFPNAGKVILATNFPRMQQNAFTPVEKRAGELTCIFISRLSPKKNIHYLLLLLPQLPAGINITFEIRGEPEDKKYWQYCLSLIAALPANITVAINGPVENDAISHLLQQHHLFVLPTLGENFGHAIFEALSAGRPVLISDKTPWRQLAEKKAGWDVPLQNEKAFLEVLELAAAMTAIEWHEWCKGAWQLANNFITQTDIKKQYLALFN